ncbi:hypothetical protein [Photorhabdus akhurstii]|uniref:hypothetical protein n=1 Tax=Photorhabdus akhurstii TaxID=171438 RepID=UPI001C2E1AA0|nr:hypothetical protein [Photorhabdus akhurstii]
MKYIILMMVLLVSNVYAENIEKYIPKTVYKGMNYEDKEITLKTPRTVEEFHNLEKLAEKGSADANFLLGRLYSDSALAKSERDYKMAKYYYEKALDLDKNPGQPHECLNIIQIRKSCLYDLFQKLRFHPGSHSFLSYT